MSDCHKKLLCFGLWLVLLLMMAGCDESYRPALEGWPPAAMRCQLKHGGGYFYADRLGGVWVRALNGDMYPREDIARCAERP